MRLRQLPERVDEVGFHAQVARQEPGLARLCDAQVVPLICGVHLPSLGATSANAGEARPGFHSAPATIPHMPNFAAWLATIRLTEAAKIVDAAQPPSPVSWPAYAASTA